jgi:hypothetical protein
LDLNITTNSTQRRKEIKNEQDSQDNQDSQDMVAGLYSSKDIPVSSI